MKRTQVLSACNSFRKGSCPAVVLYRMDRMDQAKCNCVFVQSDDFDCGEDWKARWLKKMALHCNNEPAGWHCRFSCVSRPSSLERQPSSCQILESKA